MDPVKAYRGAVEALARAEKQFQTAMDAVHAARNAQDWNRVPSLRKAAEAAERALDDALENAQRAHREYWIARRIAEVPNLHAAAITLRRFTVISRAAGDSTAQARGTFDSIEITADETDPCCDDVPIEGPDSDLIWSRRDPAWHPRY